MSQDLVLGVIFIRFFLSGFLGNEILHKSEFSVSSRLVVKEFCRILHKSDFCAWRDFLSSFLSDF